MIQISDFIDGFTTQSSVIKEFHAVNINDPQQNHVMNQSHIQYAENIYMHMLKFDLVLQPELRAAQFLLFVTEEDYQRLFPETVECE